jgi:hypothetical protein
MIPGNSLKTFLSRARMTRIDPVSLPVTYIGEFGHNTERLTPSSFAGCVPNPKTVTQTSYLPQN